MKTRIFVFLFSCILLLSCNKKDTTKENTSINYNPVDSSQELKRKELELKEREISLEEKKYEEEKKKEKQIDKANYISYFNSRYDYSIKYPDNITNKRESSNGDGCTFKIYNEFEMKVWGSYVFSEYEKGISQYYEEELNGTSSVIYNTLKNNWFVISGYRNNKVYYTKQILENGILKVLYITYDKSFKDKYDQYIETISKSFKSS